jgi:uncharacterized Tic20 family protein
MIPLIALGFSISVVAWIAVAVVLIRIGKFPRRVMCHVTAGVSLAAAVVCTLAAHVWLLNLLSAAVWLLTAAVWALAPAWYRRQERMT